MDRHRSLGIGMSMNILKHLKASYVVLGVFLLSAAVQLAAPSVVSAAGETYKYSKNEIGGSTITASSGLFSQDAFFGADISSDKVIKNYKGYAEIPNAPGGHPLCKVGMTIAVNGAGTAGVISTPAFMNSRVEINPAGYDGPVSCSKEYVAGIADLNKEIAISGSAEGAETTNPDDVVETDQQKVIEALIYSDKKVSELPFVQATIRAQVNPSERGDPKDINWNESASVGTARWKQEAGTYTVCLIPGNVFPDYPCQTFVKVKKVQGKVTFGSSDTSYNEEGKMVKVYVEIESPKHNGQLSYGPLDLDILASGGLNVASGVTDLKTSGAVDGVNIPTQTITLYSEIDGLKPGKYKACVANQTNMCASFTKKLNTVAEARISVSEEKSALLMTPPIIETSSCEIDGIGWIVCPISNSLASGIDNLYDLIARNFLEFKSYSTDQTQGLYVAWSLMRNVANIAFVMSFMVIIYSQLTSFGISNYGIKKLLPRLIVAAILVNISYWVCGLLVDVSNILGSSLNDVLMSLRDKVSTGPVSVSWADVAGSVLTGTTVGAVSIFAVVSAAASFKALLWMLVLLLISAIFSVLVAFLVLAARQVIIVLLIVLSPLAFVAYLLPNTQKWYSKWQKSLITLLLMYPVIAVIFAGSQFASAIILSAAKDSNGKIDMITILLALAIQVVPLALTPMVIKLSSGVLGKFAGIVNNPNRGPLDSIKRAAKERQGLATRRGLDPTKSKGIINRMGQRSNDRRRQREMTGKSHDAGAEASWQERIATDGTLTDINNTTSAQNSRASEAQRVQRSNYINAIEAEPVAGVGGEPAKVNELLSTAAGMGGALGETRIKASIISEQKNELAQDIKNAKISAKIPPGELDMMAQAFKNAVGAGDSVTAQAMQDLMLTSGAPGIKAYRDEFNKNESTMNNMNPEMISDLRSNILDNHAGIKSSAADLMMHAAQKPTLDANGNKNDPRTLGAIGSAQTTWTGLSDMEIAQQKPDSIDIALKAKAISKEQMTRVLESKELNNILSPKVRETFMEVVTRPDTPNPRTSTPTSNRSAPDSTQYNVPRS